MKDKKSRRINKKQFVLNAIHELRKPGYLGMHVVYSGFNEAFREYYEEDPIAEVDKLVIQGIVVKQPVKGGVMLYDAAEYKKRTYERKKVSNEGTKMIIKKIIGE